MSADATYVALALNEEERPHAAPALIYLTDIANLRKNTGFSF